jgi:hypothetical protein
MQLFDRKSFLLGLGAVFLPKAQARETSSAGSANVRNFGAKGDGVSDDTKAFAECLKKFQEAYVPAGTYIINELSLNSSWLHGPGTLKLNRGEDCIVVSGKGSRIEGLRFATTQSTAKAEIRLAEGCEDVTVTGCHFEGKSYSVLAADDNTASDKLLSYRREVKRVLFNGNFVTGYVVPLYLHSVSELTIEGNFFRDSFYDAIRLRQNIERAIISHNHFDNIGTSVEEVSKDAIDTFWSGKELVITGNVVKKTGCNGFDLKGFEPNLEYLTRHVLVMSNHIEDVLYTGILLSAAGVPKDKKFSHVGPFTIQGNSLVGGNRKGLSPYEAAIWVHHGVANAQINNNHITGHQGHGIALTNALPGSAQLRSIQVNDNKISGCQFKGKAAGLFFQQVDLLQVRNNFVEGCDLAWGLEKILDPIKLRHGLDMEGNFFMGESQGISDSDLSIYIKKHNKNI